MVVRATRGVLHELQPYDARKCAAMLAMTEGLAESCFAQRQGGDVCPNAAVLGAAAAYIDQKQKLRDRIAAERGARLRPFPVAPYGKLAAVVDAAAADAFFRFAKHAGADPAAMRQNPNGCDEGRMMLQHELRKRGVETAHMRYSRDLAFHHFLRTTQTVEPLVLDPTWQQFLPEGTDYGHLPHTMIIAESRLEEGLTAYGVADHAAVWLTAKPQASGDIRQPNSLEHHYAYIFAEDSLRGPLRPYEHVWHGGQALYTSPSGY